MLTYLLTNGLCTHKLLLSMLSFECRQFHLSFACNGSHSTTEEEVQKNPFKTVLNAFLHSSYQVEIIVQ